MIERFNGRVAEVLVTTRFDSAEHLADTINRYVKVYNQHIPQKALGHIPPLQAMKNWSQKQTQLFKKCGLFMDSRLVRIFCANLPSQKARGASYNLLFLLRKDCLFCHRSECYGPPSPSISLESIKSPTILWAP